MKWHKYPEETPPAGTPLVIWSLDCHLVYYSPGLKAFRFWSDGKTYVWSEVKYWMAIENPTTHEK